MGLKESLGAWGILRPAEVIELAGKAGLDIAIAASLLEKESGGGRNVWGHDPVQTGGIYTKGAPVTREAYEKYKAARKAGTVGAQGVGPTQLTWSGYQDQADELGGCWDWRCNVTVGFRTLAQLQRQYGVQDGFRRYNGSGPAAEAYGADVVKKLAAWRTRLGAAALTGSATTAAPAVTPKQEDWLTMATKDEVAAAVRAVVQEELGGVVWQTTGALPDRRGPNGAPSGHYADTLWGYVMSAEGAAYRTEQLLNQLAQRGGVPAAGPVLTTADVDAIARRLRQLIFNQEV